MGAADAVLDHRRTVGDLLVRAGDADVEALRDPPAERAGGTSGIPTASNVRGVARPPYAVSARAIAPSIPAFEPSAGSVM
jgi:hypothetical protein